MITVYSIPNCYGCEALKRQLKERKLDFTEVNIREDIEAANMLKSMGKTSAPQMFVNESCVENTTLWMQMITEENV